MRLPRIVEDNPWMCATCKGVRHLCGYSPCPLIAQAASAHGVEVGVGGSVFGSSPPSAFVGEQGYPRVLGGPLVPQREGDTSLYEDSSRWLELGFPRLIEMRLSLLRLMARLDVHAHRNTRLLDRVQEVALGARPVDVEARVASTITRRPSFSFYTPPMGSSVLLESITHVSNPSVPRPVERVVGDLDLGASEGLFELWRSGVGVDYAQRLLSAGLLGRRRRLVPTRWSITAVDDSISKRLLEEVRDMPLLDQTVAGFHRALGNSFGVILFGGRRWRFEMLESWAPYVGVLDESYNVPSDREEHGGRTRYASNLGGAYYAARLGVAEHLHRLGRQAQALVLMEVDRGWLAPLGVWRVREGVRAALRSPTLFEDPRAAIDATLARMATKRLCWIRSSETIRELLFNRTLDEYL